MNNDMIDLMINLAVDPKSMYPTQMDRYRDFRQLFMDTDQGTRVFKEIMIQGRMLTSNAARGDSHETYLREGKRDLAIIIMKLTFQEPADPPKTQVSTKPEEG